MGFPPGDITVALIHSRRGQSCDCDRSLIAPECFLDCNACVAYGDQDTFEDAIYLRKGINRVAEEPFFPETEAGTGTVGTVFQKPKPELEPSLSNSLY